MSTMQGSGVRVRETDESFTSYDVVSLGLAVPMMTKRGKVGEFNEVSASDFADIIGYDLDYSAGADSYLGLKSLLQSYSKVKVLRLNKDAYYGNVVVFRDGTFIQTNQITDPDLLEAVVCSRTREASAASSSPVSLPLNEPVKPGTFRLLVAGIQWAHDDGTTGALVVDGTHAGLVGTVNYSTGMTSITFPSGSSFPLAYVVQFTHDSDVAFIAHMESPGDWDDLAIRLSRYFETLESFATSSSVALTLADPVLEGTGSYRLENISGDVLATSGVVTDHVAPITGTGITGTINFATGAVALTFDAGTFPAAGYPMVLEHRYILNEAHFLFEVLRKVSVNGSDSYSVLESKRISFISTASDYAGSVAFENVTLVPKASLQVMKIGDTTPIDLLYGNDGTIPSASDLDFTKLKTSDFNMVCMNGLLGASLISAFVSFFSARGILVLYDVTNVQTSVAAAQYAASVVASERSMAFWRGDFVTVDGKRRCIYPSVKAALAYALMFKKTGTLNYPPAGYQFAAVAATELLVTDAEDNLQYLKVNKVNHIIDGPSGPVMWEQRTRYAAESDLSYANVVMTLSAVENRCKAFGANFNFRIITADILVAIKTGLEAIATDYLTAGFVWKCDFDIPSFDEVKASGARNMTIPTVVKVAEDGEEFTFDVHVVASA